MITVCIATYNGSRYIVQQLQSVLPQLGDGDEVVVSDDGSTDGTPDIIRHIGDRRIRLIEGPRRHSPTLNFECALRHARGEYIFLADQDDVWDKDKVAVCMAALQRADCVVSDAWVTDSQLRVTSDSLYSMMRVRRPRIYNLLWHNGYTGCCMAFRRLVLDTVLPFPKDIPMHDIWIGNVAAWFYSIEFINDRLLWFRRHNGTTSCNGKGSRFSVWRQLLFRWNIIKRLTCRMLSRTKKKQICYL